MAAIDCNAQQITVCLSVCVCEAMLDCFVISAAAAFVVGFLSPCYALFFHWRCHCFYSSMNIDINIIIHAQLRASSVTSHLQQLARLSRNAA